jgi:hypothetical protein
MRRTDARSAQIDRCCGVVRSFQVSLYKVEPSEAVLACNLLAKDNWRAALADEVVESGPEVPRVIEPAAFACRAERLARAASCPDGSAIRPFGKAQGTGPDADPREKVTLGVSSEVIGVHVLYAALVHVAGGDVTGGD